MSYFLAKAIHLTGMAAWIGTMLMANIFMVTSVPDPLQLVWLRRTMTAGLVVTWIAGLWLAVNGGWFNTHWLGYKLIIVIALTALHGVIVGRLRRGEQEYGFFWRCMPIVLTVSVLTIAYLAASKHA